MNLSVAHSLKSRTLLFLQMSDDQIKTQKNKYVALFTLALHLLCTIVFYINIMIKTCYFLVSLVIRSKDHSIRCTLNIVLLFPCSTSKIQKKNVCPFCVSTISLTFSLDEATCDLMLKIVLVL